MGSARHHPSPNIIQPFTLKVRVGSRIITLRLTPDPDDGGYVVTSPTLRGLNTEGDTVEEAVMNGREAASALLTESRRRNA